MAIRSSRMFFRYVWRFNALAIAIAALVFLVIGGYAMLRILKEETRDRRVTNVVNVSEQDKISEDLVLGRPSIIDGTPYVQILSTGVNRSAGPPTTTRPATRTLSIICSSIRRSASRGGCSQPAAS
ncbi:hypothetical protein ACQR1I_10555 [Bradyrhizobium sp. HKCCYLS2038]|uniref:hypothetical protein n=1 Tax=unclassified Bradyrhizobium TaxID=2631580 RepID=UPI003EBB01F1